MNVVIDATGLSRAAPAARSYGREMLRSLLEAGSEHEFCFPCWPHRELGCVERFLGPLSAPVKARITSPSAPRGPWLAYSPVGTPPHPGAEIAGLRRDAPRARVATVVDEEPRQALDSASAVIALTRSALQVLSQGRGAWRQEALWIPPGLSQRRPVAVAPSISDDNLARRGKPHREPATVDYLLAQGVAAASSSVVRASVWRILQAFRALRRHTGARLRLIFLGSAPFPLHQMASWLGLAREVEFLDPRTLDEIAHERLLASAMAFVHASRPDESWLVAAEAMRCGVPVVVPNTPYAADLWGDAGLYYESTSTLDLSRTLERMYASPTLRRIHAQRGITRGQAFAWEACARRVLDSFAIWSGAQPATGKARGASTTMASQAS